MNSNTDIKKLFRDLWKQHRVDKLRTIEDVGDRVKPTEIFGSFKSSNKRRFTDKHAILLDMRPLESWDGNSIVSNGERLSWLEGRNKDEVSIMFELADGRRIIGTTTRKEYEKQYSYLGIGDACLISGVFELIKDVDNKDIYMFFRIENIVSPIPEPNKES